MVDPRTILKEIEDQTAKKQVNFDHLWRILEKANSIKHLAFRARRRTKSNQIKEWLGEIERDSEYIKSLIKKYTH